MAVRICTTASTILCPHGGRLILTTANTKATIQGSPALLVTDVHSIAGCPFTLPGPKPSPCVVARWAAGATQSKVDGTPVLLETSIGTCYSPEQAPQGVAIVVQVQQIASGI